MYETPTYESLIEHNPKIAQVIDEKIFDFSGRVNDQTVDVLGEMWRRHFKKNLSLFYKKKHHVLLHDDCSRFGVNKAVIGIGAGPSFNRNKDYLRKLCLWNATFPFEEQPFLFIASNHQFKPCVNEGIIPHFVALADASESDAIMGQLCDGIADRAHHTILLCSLNANPRLLKEWDRQKKLIRFYIPPGSWNKQTFEERTGDTAENKQLMQGGNVMNVMWVASWAALGSTIFMAVGCDLSYEIESNVEKRRKDYYADGDYSTNLASKRDEAAKQLRWVGFDLKRNPITINQEPFLTFKPYATVSSLFNYKVWVETMVGIQDANANSFHYYNCSEKGILGVLAKSYDVEYLENTDNWTLMDEVFPNRWHTRTLEDAASTYLASRELWLRNTVQGALASAGILRGTMDSARIVAPNGGPL